MGSHEILGSNSPIMCPNNYVAVLKHPSDCSSYTVLKDVRLKKYNKIIFAHLNINSIRNKFDMITDLIKGRIDILLISETKIDNTFPTSQFVIPGFSSPFRLDRSEHGGRLLLYLREDIPARNLPSQTFDKIECLIVEIKIYKRKWLIFGSYNPNKSLISIHLSILSKNLDHYMPTYDNCILLGNLTLSVPDINTQISRSHFYIFSPT